MELIRNDDDYQIVPLKLSEEEYAELENLAACGYTPRQVAMCLDVDPAEFERQLQIVDSLVHFHFTKGILQSDFEISSKLLDNAKSGNITAVEIFSKRRGAVNLHNLKSKYLNDGY